MNPLTQIKNTQKISRQEIANGVSEAQSWHARFKHSAYIYTGGLPFTLTDGDLLAVFSQYGEVIDVNLIRSKDTGKSRGFAFLAYEDQKSTNLAVDNLNGSKIGGRIVTVDHVDNYKRKIAEVEGREPSESGGSEEVDVREAENAAMDDAMLDGAQIVSTSEAVVQGGRDRDDEGNEDTPWASKSSIHAILSSKLPTKRKSPDIEDEDPLAAMKEQKRHKKEEKRKRKEEHRRDKEDRKKEKKDKLNFLKKDKR